MLVALLLVVLAAVAAAFGLAARYYASDYARATKRDWREVMGDAHAREVYRASLALARGWRRSKAPKALGDAARQRAFSLVFAVDVPAPEGEVPVRADVVAVTPWGLMAVMVQEGEGALHGEPLDESWLAVTSSHGATESGTSERFFPNLSARAEAMRDDLQHYLQAVLRPDRPLPLACAVAFSRRLRFSGASFAPGIDAVSVGELSGALAATCNLMAPVVFGAPERSWLRRVLRACSSARVVGGLGEGGGEEEPRGVGAAIDRLLGRTSAVPQWVRGAILRERPDTVGGDLAAMADRLTSQKEGFDALTWDRIIEVADDLATERNPERIVELAAELKLIARTNIALNYRFGIEQAPVDAPLSGAGLVMGVAAEGQAAKEAAG